MLITKMVMSMRIGIFGGSFNPIHKMHYDICRYLINQHYVDKIIIVPTGSEYKYKDNLVKDTDRYNMIKLVCDKDDRLEVSDYEFKDHVVYTIDTLEHFKDLYKEDEIYFICGADNLSYMDKWMRGIELLSVYNKLVINRRMNNIDEILEKFKEYKDKITVVPMEMNDISSTEIRNKISRGEDVSLYLDEDVIKYIKDNNLYKGGLNENI